ncbi:MAG: hypothetical protein LBF97_02805 [Elusimicrobiota bacterium]|nr:hypothetical protein [Elusimicrobiota bacterium]
MFQLKVDTRPLLRFKKDILRLQLKIFPYIVRYTLNSAAIESWQIARNELPRHMIVRTKFTISGIRYKLVPNSVMNIKNMVSYLGVDSKRRYLAKLDKGEIKKHTPVPTLYSRGGNIKAIIPKMYRLNTLLNETSLSNVPYWEKLGRKRDKGFFLITKKTTGMKVIFERTKGVKKLEPLRVWNSEVTIKARHWMKETAVNSKRLAMIYRGVAAVVLKRKGYNI